MQPERIAQLTEGQLACLRLVYQHKSSKEIARALGISKDTVDQRLDRARKLIGAASRVEAARCLAEWEAEYHRIVYDPATIAPSHPTPASAPPADDAELRQRGYLVRETQAEYLPSSSWPTRLRLPFQSARGERNELGTWERVIWIALISAAIPLLLGSLIMGLWALGRIASSLNS